MTFNEKLGAGTTVVDSLLNGGYERGIITTIYGPAGAGKTNLSLLASIKAVDEDKKVIYVDTEGGFSVERLKQLTPNHLHVMSHVLFMQPTTFSEQQKCFERLKGLISNKIGLIVIDSIAMLYRVELGTNTEVYETNRELGRQLSLLTQIARKKHIPVLITNQVYSSFDDRDKDRVSMVGGDLLHYGSKCLIELKNNKDGTRTAILQKHRSIPPLQTAKFRIVGNGVDEVKK